MTIMMMMMMGQLVVVVAVAIVEKCIFRDKMIFKLFSIQFFFFFFLQDETAADCRFHHCSVAFINVSY